MSTAAEKQNSNRSISTVSEKAIHNSCKMFRLLQKSLKSPDSRKKKRNWFRVRSKKEKEGATRKKRKEREDVQVSTVMTISFFAAAAAFFRGQEPLKMQSARVNGGGKRGTEGIFKEKEQQHWFQILLHLLKLLHLDVN